MKISRYLIHGGIAAPLLFPGVSVLAQGEQEIEEVVVVGTRAAPRTSTESSVPVDAIGSEALLDQDNGNMFNLLRATVPSFHVNENPSRDAAALLRPVNLRGLAPDHALVLVNNKRRHRGAVIQWISNGASDGAQGPDVGAIPAAAIERVEVLRDGAAAQYGSDAIAGVVNFVLRDDAEGGSIDVRWGAHTEDTAESFSVLSGNVGMPVGDDGFLNLSAEYGSAEPTVRSVQHPDAAAMQAVGVDVADPAKPWGSAEVKGSIKTFANAGFDIGDDARIYGFANYATRDVSTAFFYRSPQGRSGVYVYSDGDDTKILIGGGDACKAKYDYLATPENVVTVRDKLTADTDCFAFAELLPEGFTPNFGATMTDYSVVAGLDGALDAWNYDVSFGIGSNGAEFYIEDTVNASYGPETPRSFDVGQYIQTETSFNADASRGIDVGAASDLNVAAGFEWRSEEFEIVTGEEASWKIGPYNSDGFAARSNGFGGFNEASSGTWSRSNIAAYVDLEVDVTPEFRAGGAVRYEDFEDFGTVFNYKATGRLQIPNSPVALRGSYGTGFRAPTPGQQNANNLSTVVDSATGVFREQGTVASTNPVALELGGEALDAESSTSFTIGAVLQLDTGIDLTVDYFNIQLEDRIALSENMSVDDALRKKLTDAGVAAAVDFERIRYFTNDYDTTTSGIDVVLTYGFRSDLGATDVSFGFNQTTTEVTESEESSTESRRTAIEEGSPEARYALTVQQAMGDWDLTMRYNFFGSWYDSDDGQTHDGYAYLDLAARYQMDNGLAFSVGLDNALDTYPSEASRSPSAGRLYPRYSPAGYNGRSMYLRGRFLF